MPTHFQVQAQQGLERDSLVLLEQIRTVDKARLREFVGRLEDEEMAGIDRALAVSLQLK